MATLILALFFFLRILEALLLARVIMSWFRPRYRTSGNGWFFTIDEYVWRATEPLLAPIRNILPTGGMGLDLSPLILFFLISLIQQALARAI